MKRLYLVCLLAAAFAPFHVASGQTTITMTANATWSTLVGNSVVNSSQNIQIGSYTLTLDGGSAGISSWSAPSFSASANGGLVTISSSIASGTLSAGTLNGKQTLITTTTGNLTINCSSTCFAPLVICGSASNVILNGTGASTLLLDNTGGYSGGGVLCTNTAGGTLTVNNCTIRGSGSVGTNGSTIHNGNLSLLNTNNCLVFTYAGTSASADTIRFDTGAAAYYSASGCTFTSGGTAAEANAYEAVSFQGIYTYPVNFTCTSCNFVQTAGAPWTNYWPTIAGSSGNNYVQLSASTGTINYPAAATIMGPWKITNNAQGTATSIGPWTVYPTAVGPYPVH